MAATSRTRIKGRILPRFPASLFAGNMLELTRSGASVTYAFTMTGLTEAVAPTVAWRLPIFDPSGGVYRYITATGLAALNTVTLSQISDMNAGARAAAALTAAADKITYYTGASAAALADLTSPGRSMIAASTAAAQTALLSAMVGDSGSGGTKGLAPAPAAGDAAAGKFLKADGSYAVPPGTAGQPLFPGFVNNLEITASVGSSALTVALKNASGNDPDSGDPVTFVFPSATEGSGTQTTRTLSAASSIVISSGSTMGAASSTAFRLWLVMFDDAGTLRPGLINCRNSTFDIYQLKGWGVASSTAEGGAGAADSAHVFYTGTAVTSKPYIVLGYVEYNATGITAGTYSTAPQRIRMHQRGMALPGDVVQSKMTTYTTNADLTTAVPVDDTIPQNTEGTQIASHAMTLDSPANKVEVDYGGFGGCASAISIMFCAFSSLSANAFSTTASLTVAGFMISVHGLCDFFANSAASVTYSLRVGGSATVRLNGTTSGRLFGGSGAAYLRTKEIMS